MTDELVALGIWVFYGFMFGVGWALGNMLVRVLVAYARRIDYRMRDDHDPTESGR